MTQDVFAALANPVRRKVLELLIDGPRAAGEIAAQFELNRPAVSEHLQVLRKHGLVAETAQGRERHYRLEAERLQEVEEWLKPFDRYWRARIDALKVVLDEESQK